MSLASSCARVFFGLVGLVIGLSCSYDWASLIQYPGEDCSGTWVWQPPSVHIMGAYRFVLGQGGHIVVALAILQAGISVTAALRST